MKPIDTQQAITQLHIAEKVQNIQQQYSDVQQRHFAHQFDVERKKQRETVKFTPEEQPLSFQVDRYEGGGGSHKREKGSGKDKGEEKKSGGELPRTKKDHIDIKV
ncbi:MAG: hypothetical protein N2317_06145 [Syntrophales bacterium]|nr:hypothetical protein [Syntrophales bacterium]